MRESQHLKLLMRFIHVLHTVATDFMEYIDAFIFSDSLDWF